MRIQKKCHGIIPSIIELYKQPQLKQRCANTYQMFLFIYLQVKPLIWIESVIERHAHSRIEFMVKAKSQFKRRSTANNVEIIIPVPNDADSPKFKTTIGHCKYEPETQSIKWTIKSFPGKLW